MKRVLTCLLLLWPLLCMAQSETPQDSTRRRPKMPRITNEPMVHDPVLAQENGRYYMFCTGFGIDMWSSEDRITWKRERPVLDPIPAWAHEAVPAYQGHTWAPDICRVGDKWYLYYSCSTFGKNISAIGVAVNKTLDPSSPDYHWQDLGQVVHSQPKIDDYNAIDPNLIIDKKGKPWLTFGSFWDGIQLVRLDKDLKTPIGKPVTIARRLAPDPDGSPRKKNNNAIEAPFIVRRGNFYYLFVSYDFCCKGLSSNYKIAVGRSRKLVGPYLDRNGKPMLDAGGEVIAAESDRYAGVGHCGVYEFDGQWFVIAHAYDKTKNGASMLYLHKINWNDGWPVIEQ